MSEIPERARRLAEERAARDFARADALRDELARLGWEVLDVAGGWELRRAARFEAVDHGAVPSLLAEPAPRAFSVHLLYEGYPDDLRRFLAGLERHCAAHDYEAIVVDDASGQGDALEDLAAAHREVSVLHLGRSRGWAAARNAGLIRSRGAIMVIADASIEPRGDVLGPLARALSDPAVGVAGPFGVVSEDLREFHATEGPAADAIEGYLMAVRREDVVAGLRFREAFRWYRNADLDLSFEVRSRGRSAMVVECPVERHEHRGWGAMDEPARSKASRRNFYRFLDRWRHREDLLIARGGPGAGHEPAN